MKSRRLVLVVSAALAIALVCPLVATTVEHQNNAPANVIVNFGDPAIQVGTANQVVVPDDVTVLKGGSVIFVVHGPGHGIAIYPVSRNTTRDDITAQLCAHDAVTQECLDPTFANGDRTIRDGQNNAIIVTGTNPPIARVDDPARRLLATSTQIDGVPGVFLTGTTATAAGTQLQFQFTKTGRYLVVCMNRNHMLSNWMFGFVTVHGDDEQN